MEAGLQAPWIYRNLKVSSAPPFHPWWKDWGKTSSAHGRHHLLSHQVPLPLPPHSDTQHPPLLAHPTGLGRALVLRRGHHSAPRRPRLGRPLLSK